MSSTLEDPIEDFDQLILKIMEEMRLDRSEYDHLHNISIMAIDILDSNPTYYNKIISDPELFSFLLDHVHKRMIKDSSTQTSSISKDFINSNDTKPPSQFQIHIPNLVAPERSPSIREDESSTNLFERK